MEQLLGPEFNEIDIFLLLLRAIKNDDLKLSKMLKQGSDMDCCNE